MSLPLSREVGAIVEKAEELAEGSPRGMTTGHLLAAMLEVPNQAASLLADHPLDSSRFRNRLGQLDSEADHLVGRVRERSERLASGARSEAITSHHLLAALTRESRGHAYRLLKDCDVDIGAMRTAAMSYATTSRRRSRPVRTGPSSQSKTSKKSSGDSDRSSVSTDKRHSRSSIGFHPSLRIDRGGGNDSANSTGPPRQTRSTRRRYDESSPDDGEAPSAPGFQARRTREEESDDLSGDDTSEDRSNRERRRPTRKEIPRDVRLDLREHPGINRGGRPKRYRDESESQESSQPPVSAEDDDAQPSSGTTDGETAAHRRAEALEDARKTTRDLADRLFSGDDGPRRATRREDEDRFDSNDEQGDPELAAEYELDADEFPNLSEYGRNLTVEAALGNIDAVIGRDNEIGQAIDILGKRRSNNPLLVGEPGVGKTAIVEGLALRFVEMKRRGAPMGERVIIELEMSRLLSGTHLRGAFSERLLGIKDEVAAADGNVIVFLDEIHMWMDAGTGGDGGDAAGELKTALARGRFPCIGATTLDEFRQFVESDPAFERRFQRVNVEEPDEETALRIVEGVRTHYERHHGVEYTPGALAASVTLSNRYIHDRHLPDKAIGVLDLAGSRAARRGHKTVDRQALSAVVAEMASIPRERLTRTDGDRFLQMESFLSERIVGHNQIVETVAELLRRNYAGFRGQRPIGSLLFLGPTGVGKTEMVKVLADFLFHDRDAIVQVDMSEFMESHSVSRLIGSPPGYVGHDDGGQLTERIRQRPYQVVLLDEIEKAHSDVLNLLLQLFDEGRLTDGRGRQVDFSNALVVMTSNLGAGVFDDAAEVVASPTIGFSRRDEAGGESRRDGTRLRDRALEAAGQHFTPELWNRIDEKLVFLPLSREEIADIARLQLADSKQKLLDESDIEMDYGPGVVEHLIENGGYDPEYGARPMRQTIERLVEGKVARAILAGTVSEGGRVLVGIEEGEIAVKVQ